MVQKTIADLDAYLQSLSLNTISTPYEIEVTDASTTENIKTIANILQTNRRYVDLTLTMPIILGSGTFSGCVFITNLRGEISTSTTDMSSCFFYCTSLQSVPTIPNTVKSLNSCFYSCKSLTEPIKIPTGGVDLEECFRGCTGIASISDISFWWQLDSDNRIVLPKGIFKGCTSLASIGGDLNSIDCIGEEALSGTAITSFNSSGVIEVGSKGFQNCTNLISVYLPNCQTLQSYAFDGCTALASTSFNNAFYIGIHALRNTSLYCAGYVMNDFINTIASGVTSLKAIGIRKSYQSYIDYIKLEPNNSEIKLYVQKDGYNTLLSRLQSFPESSGYHYKAVAVDAVLFYDELESWLESQPDNTEDTAYKIFIAGGLDNSKLQGVQATYYTTPIESPLGIIIREKNKFVDLSELCLPSNCTQLYYSFQNISYKGSQYRSGKVVSFCEIPSHVTSLIGTFYNNEYFKRFANGNVIPSTVKTLQSCFSTSENIDDLFIEHRLTSEYNYSDYFYNSRIFVKDYSKCYSCFPAAHNNRKLILECEYNDLDTYLEWFIQSVENVNLKVNGLEEADLIGGGTSSPFTSSNLCSKLLGTNIEDSTVKGYVAASTFDLRLTEIPSTQTSLLGCFVNGNVSYSFDIPDTVTNMNATYQGSPLKKAPVLPNALENLKWTFYNTDITEAPSIPSTITDLSETFYLSKITEMPELSSGIISLDHSFGETNIISTKNIPNSVTDMEGCFQRCANLKSVSNIPSSVTDMRNCFDNCSSLTIINNWDLDIETNETVMTNAFSGCTSLARINTTSTYKKDKGDGKWQLVRVVTNSSDSTKYDIDIIELKSGTESSFAIDKSEIRTYFTDEMMFSPQGAITDQVVEDFINYRFPWRTKETDIAVGGKKHFFVQASDDSIIHQNIFDPSSLNIPQNTSDLVNDSNFFSTDNVLPLGSGGTGKTTAQDACNELINGLSTDSSTPVDADYYISQYVNGGTTTKTYHRRPMSALWEYIKGKISSIFNFKPSTDTSAKKITSFSVDLAVNSTYRKSILLLCDITALDGVSSGGSSYGFTGFLLAHRTSGYLREHCSEFVITAAYNESNTIGNSLQLKTTDSLYIPIKIHNESTNKTYLAMQYSYGNESNVTFLGMARNMSSSNISTIYLDASTNKDSSGVTWTTKCTGLSNMLEINNTSTANGNAPTATTANKIRVATPQSSTLGNGDIWIS